VYLPILEIKKFLKQKALAVDVESAGKQIMKYHGKKEQLDYEEFYEMFCKGIFRVAMQDLMSNIEKLTKDDNQDLPLMLKLGAYRRNLMLSGLDKEDGEWKKRGKQILYAM